MHCVRLVALLFLLPALHSNARAQGGALLFDGIDDRASAIDANDDFDLASAMTLEAWVRVDVAQAGGGFVGASTGGGGAAWVLGAGIGNPTDGLISVSVPNTDAVFAPAAIQTGAWTHFAGTFDGSVMQIFVNGAFVAMSTHGTGGSSSVVASLVLGKFPVVASSLHFKGAMDEVRVWNVVRTAAEIQQSYSTSLVGNESGLVGYYKFDEIGGQTITDSSTFGNDGVLGDTNAVATDDPARIVSGAPLGAPFVDVCSGDGGDQMGCTDCPCGNNAAQGTIGGCMNSAGSSTRLLASGTASTSAANLRLEASGAPPSTFVLLTSGGTSMPSDVTHPCFGQGSGVQSASLDGLRCAAQSVLSHGVRPSDANGDVGLTTNGWGAPNGFFNFGAFTAGETKYFQVIHRDSVAVICQTGQNTSQAVTVTLTP